MAREIALDFKPGSTAKVINPRSRGRFWTALLLEFDALRVDPGSVELGPGNASPDRYQTKDAHGDGLPDLMLRFRTPQVDIGCGSTEFELNGETYEGLAVMGSAAQRAARPTARLEKLE